MHLIQSSSDRTEPLFVINRAALVQSLNAPARQAIDQQRGLFLASDGRLRFSSSAAAGRFEVVLADLGDATGDAPNSVTMRFSVAGEPDPNTIVISRSLMERDSRDHRSYAIVVHYRLDVFRAAASDLGDVFELTPAEQQVAKAIIGGKGLKECALLQGNSIETIRWHAKNLLTKTGCSSQVEFVTLALSMTRPTA